MCQLNRVKTSMLNGITKALPYTTENTAYRELKECITTAQSQLGGKKSRI